MYRPKKRSGRCMPISCFFARSIEEEASRCHEAPSRFCPDVCPDFTERRASVAHPFQMEPETVAAGAARQSRSAPGDGQKEGHFRR
jgi:hypothetical protein